jgi:hypothetical protein
LLEAHVPPVMDGVSVMDLPVHTEDGPLIVATGFTVTEAVVLQPVVVSV